MLSGAMRAFLDGTKAALQLGLLLLVGLLMFPAFIAGVVFNAAWVAFVAGLNVTEDFLDWVTGDFRAWRIRLVRDGDSGEGES